LSLSPAAMNSLTWTTDVDESTAATTATDDHVTGAPEPLDVLVDAVENILAWWDRLALCP